MEFLCGLRHNIVNGEENMAMKKVGSAFARLGMVAFLLALGLGAPALEAHASAPAILTVNSNLDVDSGSDGFCTLREAIWASITNANYHGCVNTGGPYGGNLIQFSIGSSTITLGSPLPLISASTTTIDGSNGGLPVVIDGASTYRVLDVVGGTLTLENLTVQHGSANSGGGVTIINATVMVRRSAFLNNAATGGDGGTILCVIGCNLTIANSTFASNTASGGAGALMVNSGTAQHL